MSLLYAVGNLISVLKYISWWEGIIIET